MGKGREEKIMKEKTLAGKNRGGESVRKERWESTGHNFGVVLTVMLRIDEYFDGMTSTFWKQFNSIIYKFNYVDRKVLLPRMFFTFVSTFYVLRNRDTYSL